VKLAIDQVLDSLTLADLCQVDEHELANLVAIEPLKEKTAPVPAGRC